MKHLYVIYYGWLASDQGQPTLEALKIAAARPHALIAAPVKVVNQRQNLTQEVRGLFQTNNILLFAYVTTAYGKRSQKLVETEIEACRQSGFDGIFLDEVYGFQDDTELEYYRSIYNRVKSHGQRLIMNTGVSFSNELIMQVTDILMLEHSWRDFCRDSRWRENYSTERFMGCSSNEPGSFSLQSYSINLAQAIKDTREAWAAGIDCYYSTDRYIELAEWFDQYIQKVASDKKVMPRNKGSSKPK